MTRSTSVVTYSVSCIRGSLIYPSPPHHSLLLQIPVQVPVPVSLPSYQILRSLGTQFTPTFTAHTIFTTFTAQHILNPTQNSQRKILFIPRRSIIHSSPFPPSSSPHLHQKPPNSIPLTLPLCRVSMSCQFMPPTFPPIPSHPIHLSPPLPMHKIKTSSI
ncbi:hypothetical protein N431DRAFT_56322 [Stipitochalara longipes BDJ]|nr:hypothetical protein N431DRAFT_56322 [Stipitochalara longipes BDJ]